MFGLSSSPFTGRLATVGRSHSVVGTRSLFLTNSGPEYSVNLVRIGIRE